MVVLSLAHSFSLQVNHDNYAAMCSFTIKETGKQVDLGLFIVTSARCLHFMTGNFWGPFSGSVW